MRTDETLSKQDLLSPISEYKQAIEFPNSIYPPSFETSEQICMVSKYVVNVVKK